MPKDFLEDWFPDHPVRWAAAFAVLYVILFLINELFSELLDILPQRIALIFLPAFARVVALVVAGLAGAIGIVIGSLAIQVFYIGIPFLDSLPISVASAIGALIAYAVMRVAVGSKTLPITLPMLLALTGIYSAFNAMIHGLFWQFLGLDDGITAQQLSLMMLGDFAGVIVMFLLMRMFIRVTSAMPQVKG